jgi:hypothetical protein
MTINGDDDDDCNITLSFYNLTKVRIARGLTEVVKGDFTFSVKWNESEHNHIRQ